MTSQTDSFEPYHKLYGFSTEGDSSLAGGENNGDGLIKGEMALWRAVITQALMDAGSNSRKPEARQEKARAIHWLLGNSEDFAAVCLNAGYEPRYVREQAYKAVERGCIWRKGLDAPDREPISGIGPVFSCPCLSPDQDFQDAEGSAFAFPAFPFGESPLADFMPA